MDYRLFILRVLCSSSFVTVEEGHSSVRFMLKASAMKQYSCLSHLLDVYSQGEGDFIYAVLGFLVVLDFVAHQPVEVL